MNGKRVPGPERGLATSALLAKYRVSCLVVQRRREAFICPEARNITFGQF
jgi:hypothetical protein